MPLILNKFILPAVLHNFICTQFWMSEINNITTTDPKLPVKIEPKDPDQQNACTTKPKPEWCRWAPNCPICKNVEEDWDGKHQKQFKQPDKNAQTNTQQKYSCQTQDMRQA